MLDETAFATLPPDRGMQRVSGRVEVHLGSAAAERPGGARLVALHQSGSAKTFLPQVHGGRTEVVLLNTAGGMTGGDALRYGLTLDAGAAATAMTQTAERAYRAGSGQARVETRVTLGAGAQLDWLPQELILFEASDTIRTLDVEMAADARFLFAESVVLGRQARGEDPLRARLHDARRVRRGGRWALIDAQAISAEVLARRGSPVLLGQARALATVGLVASEAELRLDGVRAVLRQLGEGFGVDAAASAWDGKLIVRMLARDAFDLRRALIGILEHLTGRPMPRVWQA